MTSISGANTYATRLAGLVYCAEADDFVRFRDDPNDELVASVVQAVALAHEVDRNLFRDALDESTCETLRLYAQRRTLQAKRRSSVNFIDEAIAGYALLPQTDDVRWDSWMKATLLIANSLGKNMSAVSRRFLELASPKAGPRFDIAFESMNRVTSLEDCRIAEVSTTSGTGFVETMVFRDTSSPGFATGFTPRRPDDFVVFRPLTNLAQLAVNFANGLDATSSMTTSPLVQDQVPAMVFGITVSGSYLPTTGCLSFFVNSTTEDCPLKAFIAELEEHFDMIQLTGTTATDGRAVFTDGQRLILLLGSPSFDCDISAELQTSQYAEIAQMAFINSSPTRWTAL